MTTKSFWAYVEADACMDADTVLRPLKYSAETPAYDTHPARLR